jgi:hypothetical protein
MAGHVKCTHKKNLGCFTVFCLLVAIVASSSTAEDVFFDVLLLPF